MRTTRALLAALLAAPALSLAALPLAATPAVAAESTAGRNPVIRDVALACTGDTVTGSALVRGGAKGRQVTVTLLARTRGTGFAPTGRSVTLTSTPGRETVRWTFNVASLPPTVTRIRASVTAGADTVASRAVPVSECAPGQEVPEAPVALLVPVTLVGTAAGVLALRRGRSAPTPA